MVASGKAMLILNVNTSIRKGDIFDKYFDHSLFYSIELIVDIVASLILKLKK